MFDEQIRIMPNTFMSGNAVRYVTGKHIRSLLVTSCCLSPLLIVVGTVRLGACWQGPCHRASSVTPVSKCGLDRLSSARDTLNGWRAKHWVFEKTHVRAGVIPCCLANLAKALHVERSPLLYNLQV